jgi:hypothetical protein
MSGFRWRGSFIGVVTRGEEINPREEAHFERVRKIAQVLEKTDVADIAGLSGSQPKFPDKKGSESLTVN